MLRLADDVWILEKQFRAVPPITAITRDCGDYPIFDVSTRSVTLTVGRL
ncbi:MAG TPA: hypothetical protein VGH37_19085 [Candidatus Acidoferrum sp.]